MWGWIWSSIFNSRVYLETLEDIMFQFIKSTSPSYLRNENSPYYKSNLVQNWLKNRNDFTLSSDPILI